MAEPSLVAFFSRNNEEQTLRAMWLADFVALFGVSMIIPFLPLYIQELGVTDPKDVKHWTGLLFSVNFLAAAIMVPIWGAVADKIGKKPMTLRAILGLAISIGLMYWAQNVYQLLFLRILQGLLSGFVASAIALVAGATKKERIGQALGILQTAIVMGQILGPAAGGFTADHFGYRPLFLAAAVLCVIAAIIIKLLVANDTPIEQSQLIHRESFFKQMRRITENRDFLYLFFIVGLTQVALMGMIPILPLFIQEDLAPQAKHLATWVGVIVAAHAPASFIASPFWGKAGDNKGHITMLVWAQAGAACFAFPQALVHSVTLLFASRFAMGIFTSGISPLAHGHIGQRIAKTELAASLGLVTSAQFIGNVIGPVIGSSLAVLLGTRSVFIMASAIFIIAMLFLSRNSTIFKQASTTTV